MECSNRLPSFGRLDWFFGVILGQKRLFWGTKCAVLGGHLPTWRPRPACATGEFLAQNLDLVRALPRL